MEKQLMRSRWIKRNGILIDDAYCWFGRITRPRYKEKTLGQFHLIRRSARFATSYTFAICGKHGVVITPQEDMPPKPLICGNCLRAIRDGWGTIKEEDR